MVIRVLQWNKFWTPVDILSSEYKMNMVSSSSSFKSSSGIFRTLLLDLNRYFVIRKCILIQSIS